MATAHESCQEVSEESDMQEEETPTNALLRAAHEGNVELMLKMMSDGIPVDVANQGGLQAIHFAAKAGRVEIIDELIGHGASVDAKSGKGSTPLHVACLLGQAEVVKLLLRKCADVNAIAECYEEEYTPLYMAAQIGHQVIVTLLLAQGADPTVTTKNGCTACDVALQQGFKAVSELLAEYERRINAESAAAPPGECQENGKKEPADDPEEDEKDDLKELSVTNVKLRKSVVRKIRPKSGPPPVCAEAIPSPKPSPLRSKSQVN